MSESIAVEIQPEVERRPTLAGEHDPLAQTVEDVARRRGRRQRRATGSGPQPVQLDLFAVLSE